MGALAFYARTEEEIRAALAAAREADRITVIHVAVSPDKRAPGYEGWWDVPPAAVSTRDGVNSARERYETAVGSQRRELL
jgi:3D-(3,5/4)-trihydroxycyclohexane-1,2-dione acylhydrolase (decyclizing)